MRECPGCRCCLKISKTYKRKSGSRGRAKASGWIDFDLPVGEKCSWWRLDGYETYSEDEDEDGNPEAPSGDEMVEDSEEEAIRSDIELSLSDSDLD